jgi:hypothetical protein
MNNNNHYGNQKQKVIPSLTRSQQQIEYYHSFEDKLSSRTNIFQFYNSAFYLFLFHWSQSLKIEMKKLLTQYKIDPKMQNKCLNTFSNLFINFLNGISLDDCIGEAISFIARQTKISKNILGFIFCQTKVSTTNTINQKNINKITLQRLYNSLNDKNNNQQKIHDLIIRYSIFDFVSHGNFWGYPPFIYQNLLYNYAKINHFVLIEGFASPFNHNLNLYCSLFPEDVSDFNAMGPIFDILLTYNNSSSVLWILNPPYTYCIMNLLLDAVQQRQKLYPNDQFLFLLPDWKFTQLYQYILKYGFIKELLSNHYFLYDYANNKELQKLSMNMSLGYLGTNATANLLFMVENHLRLVNIK